MFPGAGTIHMRKVRTFCRALLETRREIASLLADSRLAKTRLGCVIANHALPSRFVILGRVVRQSPYVSTPGTALSTALRTRSLSQQKLLLPGSAIAMTIRRVLVDDVLVEFTPVRPS